MQLLQALFSFVLMILNLFGPLFRFIGILLQSIPGSKNVLRFIPFVGSTESNADIELGNDRIDRHELRRRYINDPEVHERLLTEKMSPSMRLVYYNNKKLKTFQYSQPDNISVTVQFK